MVDFRYTLPFPRGNTMADGEVTLDNTSDATQAQFYDNLTGRIFEAPDTVHNLPGRQVKLRVVRNHLTALTVSRKCVAWTTAAGEQGRYIAALCASQGASAKPIDDAYTVGKVIARGDLFYVVEEGPCDVMNSSSATEAAAFTYGSLCTVDTAGRLDTAAAGDVILGTCDEDVNTTTSCIRVIVHAGLSNAM